MSYAVQIAGESVHLLPERALFVPSCRTLFVADLHWGKAAAFRAANVPVPTGTTAADLDRLTAALTTTKAERLVVLGDLLHARHGRHVDTLATIAQWRTMHAQLAIDLVRGNHDLHAGDPPPSLNIACHDALRIGPFAALHEPVTEVDGYALAGHLHPNVSLRARGQQHVRLPCFVIGAARAVLPAFSSFTGGGMYERDPRDAIYAVVDDAVLAIPPR